jgi:RHS repeat-associated protein
MRKIWVSLKKNMASSLLTGLGIVACCGLLATPASAQFTITSATLSQSSIITMSNQGNPNGPVTLTVGIIRQAGFENYSVGVQATSPDGLCGSNFTIQAGANTGIGIFGVSGVGTRVDETVTVTITGGSSMSIGATLLPNTPTATFASASLNSPGSMAVSVTLQAPLPDNTSLGVAFTVSPAGVANAGPCSIPYGGSSVSCSATASGGITTATAVTFTPYLNCGCYLGNPTGAPTTITVYPASEPSLPCPSPGCEAEVGSPINVMNGNVWVSQHDYSLPGLGGGLSLNRTWNSLWATFRGSQPVAGMFGDSWRSTYEESLVSSGSNFIQYFRSNGDEWWFQANGPSYQVTNPPNEHVTLAWNGATSQYVMTFADGTQRLFNGSGYLTAILDRNGNQASVSYDASNRISQVTDAASRTVTFAHANASFPALATSATDASGTVATYSYVAGRLSQVLYPDASQLNFAYDGNNLLTSVTDAQSKVIESHTYDPSRRGLTSQRANGVDLVTVSYPSSGTTTLTNSLSNTTNFGYSNIGLSHFVGSVTGPTCSTCGAGNTSSFAYDGRGNRTSSTDANGNTTSFTYDAMGNVLTRSNVVNGSTLTWTYTYNSFGEVLTATDPLNHTTTNTYDTHGNLFTVTTPSPDGTLPGSVTTFTYDTKGELLTIKDPLNQVTTLAYYSTGLLNTITDAQSKVTTYTYDARGNRLTAKDALNNTTQFSYDAMNRLKKITYPDTTTTQFAYDTRGRRISVTDANSKVTTYGYDDADRLTSVKDAANNTTTYGYDTESNLTSIQDANLHTTGFHYNFNRWVDRTDFPGAHSENYGYDLAGNLTNKTDRNGHSITYAYDQLNRLRQKTYPDNSTVIYTYDNASRLTQVSDPTGTYQFTFDNMGRLTGTTTSYSFLTGRNFTASYGYDAASNRTGFTDPEGGATAFVYDTLNRLQTLTPPAAFASTGNFGFSYDALSRRTQLTRPNAVTTTYGYDTLSRLLNVTYKKGTTTLDGATYTVDSAGNRLSRTPLPSGTASNYGYDAIYELTGVTQGHSTTESYTYDAVGNRLSAFHSSGWTYNSSNELTSRPSFTYTYDNDGNTLTSVTGSNTTTYAWDFENRLTSVTLPGSGGTVTFKYDPFGRRIYKSSSAGTSIFAYDGDNLVEETNNAGGVVARYEQTQNIDEPLAMLRSGATSFYHADGLGSVTSLSNSAGALAQTYAYDSFGKQTSSSGSLTNAFLYTGREFDSETGLYFYRARYYDQNVGRFISEDPARLSGDSPNFYAYAQNRPTLLVDPGGLLAEIYCERLGSGGSTWWQHILLFSIQAMHCYLRVVCNGKDETFEITGPFVNNKATPHNDPFNPKRGGRKFPVHPPSGLKCCEFENRLRDAFNREVGRLPIYNAWGPNSNTFVNQMITDAGGYGDFPIGAYSVDDGLQP